MLSRRQCRYEARKRRGPGSGRGRRPFGPQVSSAVREGEGGAVHDLPSGDGFDKLGSRQKTHRERNVMSFGGYGDDQRQSPISGDLLRWAGALLIALFGLAMYMFRTQTNPVTGEVQHIAMDVNQEKTLGLQAAPQMASQMGGAIDPRDDRRAA